MRVRWFLRQPRAGEPMIDIAAAICYADRMGAYRDQSMLEQLMREEDEAIRVKPGVYYIATD